MELSRLLFDIIVNQKRYLCYPSVQALENTIEMLNLTLFCVQTLKV